MSVAWGRTFAFGIITLVLGIGSLLSANTPMKSREAQQSAVSLPCNPASVLTLFQGGKKDAPPDVHQRPYAGLAECVRCHNTGIDAKSTIKIGGVEIPLQKEQWVLYKEIPIWSEHDKHSQAYTVLLNERSKQMGKLLGVAEIHRDQRCLACHTGFPLSQMRKEDDGLVDRNLSKKLDINAGVSCEGCHGPSGDLDLGKAELKGWLRAHEKAPAEPYDQTKPWRFRTPTEKADTFGFIDVRSPASKTKLCASCHIGDVEQGRVVTHEMYAAGHPPLPGFEIETFVSQMPRHWAEFTEKSNEVKDLFIKHTADPLYQPKTFKKKSLHRTRSLLAGALVSSSEYLRLAGQLADESIKSPVKRESWPELAVFDCYACHHDLKSPSWRQQRKAPLGVPGRPPLQEWPFTLARIALKLDGVPTADIDARLADVRKALASQPFGSAKELSKPARDAAAWFYAKGQDLERKFLTREQGILLLKEIATVASAETLDYDSARQLVWAFQVVSDDLKGDLPEAKTIAEVIDQERWRVEQRKKEDRIVWLPEPNAKDMFLLNLRAGRKAATALPGDKMARQTTEVDLEHVLPRIANYEPARFQASFRKIAEALK